MQHESSPFCTGMCLTSHRASSPAFCGRIKDIAEAVVGEAETVVNSVWSLQGIASKCVIPKVNFMWRTKPLRSVCLIAWKSTTCSHPQKWREDIFHRFCSVPSTVGSGAPGARGAPRMPRSPGAAFDTARPGGQTQSPEMNLCESIPPGFECLLFCFPCHYTIESAAGGKPRATSKLSWRYFGSAEIVKMGAGFLLAYGWATLQ